MQYKQSVYQCSSRTVLCLQHCETRKISARETGVACSQLWPILSRPVFPLSRRTADSGDLWPCRSPAGSLTRVWLPLRFLCDGCERGGLQLAYYIASPLPAWTGQSADRRRPDQLTPRSVGSGRRRLCRESVCS